MCEDQLQKETEEKKLLKENLKIQVNNNRSHKMTMKFFCLFFKRTFKIKKQ